MKQYIDIFNYDLVLKNKNEQAFSYYDVFSSRYRICNKYRLWKYKRLKKKKKAGFLATKDDIKFIFEITTKQTYELQIQIKLSKDKENLPIVVDKYLNKTYKEIETLLMPIFKIYIEDTIKDNERKLSKPLTLNDLSIITKEFVERVGLNYKEIVVLTTCIFIKK